MDIRAEILPVLWAAEKIWTKHGRSEGVTVTSANDSRHSWGSKHYSGDAVDLRVRFWDEEKARQVCKELQNQVGDDYDIVLEYKKVHIHAEYHPKR